MIDKIKKARNDLLKYCHHSDCNEINECPQWHDKCEKRLGLDTAIAWITFKLTNRLLMIIRSKRYSLKTKFQAIEDYLDQIALLIIITDLHRGQYEDLYNILHTLFNSVEDLKNEIPFLTKLKNSNL